MVYNEKHLYDVLISIILYIIKKNNILFRYNRMNGPINLQKIYFNNSYHRLVYKWTVHAKSSETADPNTEQKLK